MCPECGEPLIVLELDGIEIDYCPGCGGVWLDHGELSEIARRSGVEPGGMTDELYGIKATKRGKGRCPRCNLRLKSIVIKGDNEITLDRCPREHGIYFDRGEIQAVAGACAASADKAAEAIGCFLGDMFKYELSKPVKETD